MSIRHIFQDKYYIVRTSFYLETLFQPINLIVEEISQNKSAFQTPITSLLNEKNTMCLSDLIAY